MDDMQSQSDREDKLTFNSLWWLSPLAVYAMLSLLVIAAFVAPSTFYYTSYHEPKFIQPHHLILYGSALGFFALGHLVATKKTQTSKSQLKYDKTPSSQGVANVSLVETIFYILASLVIIAYIIWFTNFIRLYGVSYALRLFSVSGLSENVGAIFQNKGTISGVTTFTECAPVAMGLAAWIMLKQPKDRKKIGALILIILLLATVRAAVFSERIAVIETLLPFLLVLFSFDDLDINRRVLWLMPLIAIVALVIVFGLFEYVRSWQYYENTYSSYSDFILTRLFGYYIVAINSECAFIDYGTFSILPYWTNAWALAIPGISQLWQSIQPVDVSAVWSNILTTYLNPEFNNSGGFLAFYKDFGVIGFPMLFFVGFFVGRAYVAFQHQRLWGLLCYPIIVYAILELPRLFLFAGPRGFFTVVGILLAFIAASAFDSKRRQS